MVAAGHEVVSLHDHHKRVFSMAKVTARGVLAVFSC
jgi:hypothetical protein